MSMEDRVKMLEDRINALETAATVTPEFARMLGEVISSTSGKTAGSATQAVDESGSATYNVMVPPDGFIKIGDRNVPYIN